jgi:hypothetical protein
MNAIYSQLFDVDPDLWDPDLWDPDLWDPDLWTPIWGTPIWVELFNLGTLIWGELLQDPHLNQMNWVKVKTKLLIFL